MRQTYCATVRVPAEISVAYVYRCTLRVPWRYLANFRSPVAMKSKHSISAIESRDTKSTPRKISAKPVHGSLPLRYLTYQINLISARHSQPPSELTWVVPPLNSISIAIKLENGEWIHSEVLIRREAVPRIPSVQRNGGKRTREQHVHISAAKQVYRLCFQSVTYAIAFMETFRFLSSCLLSSHVVGSSVYAPGTKYSRETSSCGGITRMEIPSV